MVFFIADIADVSAATRFLLMVANGTIVADGLMSMIADRAMRLSHEHLLPRGWPHAHDAASPVGRSVVFLLCAPDEISGRIETAD